MLSIQLQWHVRVSVQTVASVVVDIDSCETAFVRAGISVQHKLRFAGHWPLNTGTRNLAFRNSLAADTTGDIRCKKDCCKRVIGSLRSLALWCVDVLLLTTDTGPNHQRYRPLVQGRAAICKTAG